MKLVGFIIALIVVVAGVLLAGAILGGARPRFHLERPAGEQRQTGQADLRQEIQALKEFLQGHQAQQATPPPPQDAPAALAAPASVTVSLPEVRVVLPPDNRRPKTAPASEDEALEQKFKGYLLTEGEDP